MKYRITNPIVGTLIEESPGRIGRPTSREIITLDTRLTFDLKGDIDDAWTQVLVNGRLYAVTKEDLAKKSVRVSAAGQ